MEELLKLLATKIIVGVGNIIIPTDINREEYMSTCMAKQTVSFLPATSPICYNNISVSQECLQNIEFPQEGQFLGSQIIYINLSENSIPIIIATVSMRGKSLLIGNKQFKFSKSTPGNDVSLIGDGNTGTLIFSVNSDKGSKGGKIKLQINNTDNSGELEVEVQGSVRFYCKEYVQVNETTHIKASNKIFLGISGFEQAVKGNILLNEVLKPLMSLLKEFKVMTAMGPSTSPTVDTLKKLVDIENKLDKILSDKVELE